MSIALLFFSTPLLFCQDDPSGGGVGVDPRWEISVDDDEQLQVMKRFRQMLEVRLGGSIDAANSLLENALAHPEALDQLILSGIDAMELVAAAARDLRTEERAVRRALAKRAKSLTSDRTAAESKIDARKRTISKLEAAISGEEAEADPIKSRFLDSLSQGSPDHDLESELYQRYRKVSDLRRKLHLQSAYAAEDLQDVHQYQRLQASNIRIDRTVDVAFDRLRDLEDSVAITSRRFQRHLRSREHGDHVSLTSAALAVANTLNVEAFTDFLDEADDVLGSRGAKIGVSPGPFSLDDSAPGIDPSGFRSWVESSESTPDGADADGEIQ